VPEGLSPAEVGKEIAEHKHRLETEDVAHERHDRLLSVIEAVLLSAVAVLAAYSGFAAAKWATRSSVRLAQSNAQRAQASRFDTETIVTRTLDSVSFNAWFSAFVAGHRTAERLAVGRFRPGYRKAFDTWLATDPAHNPHAPPGPAYMPNYIIPQAAASAAADKAASVLFKEGSDAGDTADEYIRDTVFLATVLFLVGISGHFRVRQARHGLIGVGALILVFAIVQLVGLPAPP
jgi:hypothetical protein